MGHATLTPERCAMESSIATFARVEQHSPQMMCEHANRKLFAAAIVSRQMGQLSTAADSGSGSGPTRVILTQGSGKVIVSRSPSS